MHEQHEHQFEDQRVVDIPLEHDYFCYRAALLTIRGRYVLIN